MNLSDFLSFVPPELQGRRMRPYYYPLLTGAAIAGGASLPLSLSIQNVSAFFLTQVWGRAYTAGAPETSVADPALTLQVQFSSGDDLTNGAVLFSALCGDGGSAGRGGADLVIPRLVPGGSTITVTVASFALAGTSWLVRLGLGGVNVYNT